MKYKIILLVIVHSISFSLFAQWAELTSFNLNWQGVQLWKTELASKRVLSFDGAQYPSENYLPHFTCRNQVDPAFAYDVNIINPVFVKPSTDEIALLSENLDFIPSDLIPVNSKLQERTTTYLSVSVLPFLISDGEIQKLKSFELKVTKKSIQKALTTTVHTYSKASVLAQGKFVKVKVVNSGIYKLTFEDLNSMGITPANVRVFGYGGALLEQDFSKKKNDDLPEVSIFMEKGSDGIFNSGDYILFYAQGIQRWSYDKSKAMFSHVINNYSTHGYYFVTSDVGIAKKIELKTIQLSVEPIINDIEEFTDYQVYEKDIINLSKSGKEFYGETFIDASLLNLTINMPNVVQSATTKVRLDVAASSTLASTFTLSLDNLQPKVLNVSKKADGDFYEKGKGANGMYLFTPTKDDLIFNLQYNKPNPTSLGYLNYVEINARRSLKMSGSAMQFQNVDNLGLNTYNRYILSNASSNVQIWDITNQQNIVQLQTETVDGKITFVDSNAVVKNYIAIDPKLHAAFPKPEIVGVVSNQNLHAFSPVDFVIISHPDFKAQAELLAQAHRDIDKLTVAVVTTEEVYNEFSSGTPDATSYRWMMKMLYDKALDSNNIDDLPKYLLLFGRGSYDNRKLLTNSGNNFILTYQAENSLSETLSYVTDDYFGLMDDNEGTQVPANLVDLGIGRFPVKTKEEATAVVNKTILYMENKRKGNWKNQLCFLADDGDGALHMKQADSIASVISRTFPSYQVNKIFLDAYLQEITASGERYPIAHTEFQNLLRTGLFLLDYTGHAGYTGWTNEAILSTADIKLLSNQNLPLWIGATCDFLQFDTELVSAGEHVMLNPLGGGIGILSAARPVYASQNMTINKLMCENLFKKRNGQFPRIGDVLAYAKNNVGTEINKLSYIYMGDPAVKMNYPSPYKIVANQINAVSSNTVDTLRAMSINSLSGIIVDENGNKVESFNGFVNAVVYDKMQRITTLNNEKESNGALTFSYRPNKLFSGKANVVNGEFTLSFMLPKDIKYNYGTGRINFYANDTINADEAQGNFENFVVGGTSQNVDLETDGPEIKMYLNTSNFESGDKTNESPLFIASLKDISGINRIGSGIGHDMLLTIDQNSKESYIVNDYFETIANNFKEGIVRYKLPDLAEGKHTLTFRAWDLLNNSSTQTFEFEVVNGLLPVIFSISNYPNPAAIKTKIVVNHDRPETILNTTVEIFDLAGRKIWFLSQSSADNIEWDLRANDGQKVKPGIYLYRVRIKTNETDVYSKINKLLVVE